MSGTRAGAIKGWVTRKSHSVQRIRARHPLGPMVLIGVSVHPLSGRGFPVTVTRGGARGARQYKVSGGRDFGPIKAHKQVRSAFADARKRLRA